MVKNVLLTYAMILFMSACSSSSKVVQTPEPLNLNPNSSYILFVNFLMEKSDGEHVDLKVLNHVISEGRTKTESGVELELQKGIVEMVINGAEGNVLKRLLLPDPLNKSSEYVSEQNNLERKEVHSTKEEFYIRINLPHDAQTLKAFQYVSNDKKDLLCTYVLTQE